MPPLFRLVTPLALLLCILPSVAGPAAPLINEIMYHPQDPEDPRREFVELYNPSDQPVSLAGWQLRGGLRHTFAEGDELGANSFLVVAADPDRLVEEHPGVQALGPWEGQLSNSGERLRLLDAEGREVDEVVYADEGDWARRLRGPEDRGHHGWIWENAHDGEGASLELIQPELTNRRGLNWAASAEPGGTPGRQNSRHATDSAPVIFNLNHTPIIPRDTDPVTVTATVRDESDDHQVTLVYHTESAPAWIRIPMSKDDDGTGSFRATIPAQQDREIVSFHIEATDGLHTRHHPLPEAPCLYQVESDYDPDLPWDPEERPLYRFIMSEAERAELAQIGSEESEAESNAQMNATFISQDGTGLRLRYLVGVRNRGASSRVGPPNNALVLFRSDDAWQGLSALKFNVRHPHSQAIGPVLFRRAGIPAAEALPVRLHVNDRVLAEDDYAQVEAFGPEFASNHFPDDPEGNLYQVRDDESTGDEGDLTHLGEEAEAYQNTYFKQTNENEDDWSDLIELTKRLNDRELPDTEYIEALSEIMHIDQWLRTMAVDTLLGNREGGLTSGKGDDYALYRGKEDPRFQLIPHDLDTVLGVGRSPDFDRSIWTYAGLDGLERFFEHPDVERRYLAALTQLLASTYRPEILDPLIEQVLGSWVDEETVQQMQDFAASRRDGVLDQIETGFTAEPDLEQRQGHWWSTSNAVRLTGTFPAAAAGSILVNGQPVTELDAREGTWSADTVPLEAGLNRLLVEAYGERGGVGNLVVSLVVDVWFEDAESPGLNVGGVLAFPVGDGEKAQLRLIARDSYYPGVPLLVRAELLDSEGQYRRDLWDAVVNLRTDRNEVRLEPSSIRLFNGVGSALVTIRGAAGGDDLELIEQGTLWHYLDDGSDQGTAWREIDFDDSLWQSGRGEIGYGDDDEETVVGFGDDPDAKFATTYFRTRFPVEALADFGSLTLHLKYDDAAAVYLNGSEVLRTPNLPRDAAFDDYATEDVDDEDRFEVFELPVDRLVLGNNVLAVEIHQGDSESSDISLDARLIARTALQDAGDFTLLAETLGLHSATRDLQQSQTIASLSNAPVTEVSGTLPGDASAWNGVMHVTDDLLVPPNHTLTVAPGTLILVEGDPTPLSEAGVDIDVQGVIEALGTETQPITFTAINPSSPWGEIHHENGGLSNYRYVNVTRGGHAPREGHTNTGPAFNIDATEVSLEHVAVSDIAGKILQARDGDLYLTHCHLSRAAMGPETTSTGVTIRDVTITEMLGLYREDGVTDDNDGIYLHRAKADTELEVTGLVVALTDDDGFDTLNAETLLSHSILRDCADKGASINGGHATMERCLVVGNFYGVQAKTDGVRLTMDHCTLTDNDTSLLLVDEAESIDIRNSILSAVNQEIEGDGAVIAYSLSPSLLIGQGNVMSDPLFVSRETHDYRLLPDSAARDAADPASPPDADGTRADIGRLAALDETPIAQGTITWQAVQSPIRVMEDLIVPEQVTLVVEPGTTVYVAPGKRITVRGELQVEGTPYQRIRFTTDPALPHVDDIRPGLPQGPPHWGGIRFVDSLSPNNRVAYADIGYAQDAEGSIGVIRSQVLIDHCTFHGTHLRMIYADSSSVIVQHCTFPDMFAPDENADALGLDNISEHIKGIGRYPANGHFIIQHNVFGTNKGHNDVIDVDSGLRPQPILQILNNHFAGAGDELVDLGGDVYLAGNVFYNVFKDDETSDRGYANAISTGDAVNGATVVATRNLFWDVDHAVNLKRNVATIFEYNTVYQVHGDFDDRFGNPNVGSVINLYVDEPGATPGEGAYLHGNVLIDIPRVFGNVDLPQNQVSALGFAYNWVDSQLEDRSVGQRPELVGDLGPGNRFGVVPFVSPDTGDFGLATYTSAIAAGPLGEDLGMTVRPGIWIAGEPAAVTSETTATLTLGGPGLFAYRYRLNGGPWSAPLPIGDGFAGGATERHASLTLSDLTPGESYLVEAIGQDFAGNWQPENEATSSKPWRVDLTEGLVQIHEFLAINRASYPDNDQFPDYVELWNPGSNPVDLAGWTLSDNLTDAEISYLFPQGTILQGDAYLLVTESQLGFGLDGRGEALVLKNPQGELVDSVQFGRQAADLALGRVATNLAWVPVPPSPGLPNSRQPMGNPAMVQISEWMGYGDVRFTDDFVELYNPSALPVDVSGWSLTDRSGDAAPLPPHSFIGAQSYLVLNRLSLDRLRDTLFLRDASGELRDFVLTDPQVADQSQSRDGSFAFLPTPGTHSDPDSAVESRMLALLAGLRITEIMYHPAGEEEAEFIELQNVGSTPLDLAGVRFTSGIDFSFDDGVILAPGEQLVLAADSEAFHRRYGQQPPLAGVYGGRLSNGGETLTLKLPAPYDAAILRIDFADDWQVETDGLGYSLVAVTPGDGLEGVPPREWQQRGFWRASAAIGGDPGGFLQVEEPQTGYAAWRDLHGAGDPSTDTDGDGLTDLEEYAYDTDPRSIDREASTRIGLQAQGEDFVLRAPIVHREDLVATLEMSGDLHSWEPVTTLDLPIGEIALIREPLASAAFVRLRLELEPN